MQLQAKTPSVIAVKGSAQFEDLDKIDEIATTIGSGGQRQGRKKKGQSALRGLPTIKDNIRVSAIKGLCSGLQVVHDRSEAEA